MVEWYAALSPQEQAAIQGVVVMAFVAIIKALCHWAGKPLGQTALAKLGKYATVAVLTALTTIVTTGLTAQFWMAWVAALCAAVGSWEAVARVYGLTVPAEEED